MKTLLYILLTPNLMVNHLANYLNFWMAICHRLSSPDGNLSVHHSHSQILDPTGQSDSSQCDIVAYPVISLWPLPIYIGD